MAGGAASPGGGGRGTTAGQGAGRPCPAATRPRPADGARPAGDAGTARRCLSGRRRLGSARRGARGRRRAHGGQAVTRRRGRLSGGRGAVGVKRQGRCLMPLTNGRPSGPARPRPRCPAVGRAARATSRRSPVGPGGHRDRSGVRPRRSPRAGWAAQDVEGGTGPRTPPRPGWPTRRRAAPCRPRSAPRPTSTVSSVTVRRIQLTGDAHRTISSTPVAATPAGSACHNAR